MQVSQRQYNALKSTIRYWETEHEKYGTGEIPNHGRLECYLCQLYWDNDCKSCPINIKTGILFCDGIPYDKWAFEGKNEIDHQTIIDWMKALLKECKVRAR